MNAISNIHFHIYKMSLLPVEWLGKAFKFLSLTKEGNWHPSKPEDTFQKDALQSCPDIPSLDSLTWSIQWKDILNPVDSLHHDPQKLFEKQAHKSTQIWPRNGSKSLFTCASLFPRSLVCWRGAQDARLSLHSVPQESLGQPHLSWLLCRPPAAAAAQWASIQSRNRLANTVFSCVATWQQTLGL